MRAQGLRTETTGAFELFARLGATNRLRHGTICSPLEDDRGCIREGTVGSRNYRQLPEDEYFSGTPPTARTLGVLDAFWCVAIRVQPFG
jgi:hypothetical protein